MTEKRPVFWQDSAIKLILSPMLIPNTDLKDGFCNVVVFDISGIVLFVAKSTKLF